MSKPGLTLHRLELFLAVLDRFHAAHPGIAVSLRISATREIESWVSAGQVEVGVIGEAPLLPGLEAERWVRDELVLIVPRGHAFARQRAVRAAAITGEPY